MHTAAYLDELETFSRTGGGDLDPDTFATTSSWASAQLAAGAGLTAIEALRESNDGVALVVARPPGHHALPDRAMGFCLLNNVAVTAASLAAAGERVLIVDWDVHHGNGTQQIFWNDPKVLYVSTHQWPLFPGTGRPSEVGGPGAVGYTVNLPLEQGSAGNVVRRAIEEVAMESIETFGPTWVLVSAGFDAHRDDPMAGLCLSSGDFADLARMVAGFAPRPGRLVLFLEGGYDPRALRSSVTATVGALLGMNACSEPSTSTQEGREAVGQIHALREAALRRARDPGNAEWSLG